MRSRPTSTGTLEQPLLDHEAPFPKPDTDEIAIRVINDYGDDAAQVFEV